MNSRIVSMICFAALLLAAVLALIPERQETARVGRGAADPRADRMTADARDGRGQAEHEVLNKVEQAKGGYIYLSLKELRLARKAYDSGKPFARAIVVDEEGYAARWRHIERAYEYATLVEDDVLDRAHPDMRKRWRDQYEEGLRLRILGQQDDGSLSRSASIMAEFKGVELMNKFLSWWGSNRQTVKTALRGR